MPEIGSLVIDMALKSAEFIRELDKTSKRVEQNQARMLRSVNVLQKAFGAFLTVRTIRSISNLTEESLELAASMHGPLADGARHLLTQFEELQDAFKVGLARGFIDQIGQSLDATEDRMKDAKKTGGLLGTGLGFLVEMFATKLPPAIETTKKEAGAISGVFRDAIKAANDWRDSLHNITTVAKTSSGIVLPVDDVIAYGTALELARMEQESFWSASVTEAAVEVGDRFLAQTQAEIDVLNASAGPMKQYENALLKIEAAHLQGEAGAIAHQQATANLVGNYLTLADNAATALGTLFKDSKGVAIAQAVINTAQAVTKTFAEYGATPWGFALAASMAAIGAAQIAAIATAQPGSSKATKPKSGGGAAASAGAASRGGGGGSFSQAVTIQIIGDVFGPEHFRKIAAGLNQVSKDGTPLLVVA